MKTTKIYVVVGVFGGFVSEMVVATDKDVAQAHYQRLCIEYDFKPEEASNSEHDVQLTSMEIALPGLGLTEQQVARLAFEAVELMGDIFYDGTRWGEQHQCLECDAEFPPHEVKDRENCPRCGGKLISADQRVRKLVEGEVFGAIEKALQATGGTVVSGAEEEAQSNPLARLAQLLTTYEQEYDASLTV